MLFDAKPNLLIIDDLGCLLIERRGANLLFQVVARYEKASTLLATNQTVSGETPPSVTRLSRLRSCMVSFTTATR